MGALYVPSFNGICSGLVLVSVGGAWTSRIGVPLNMVLAGICQSSFSETVHVVHCESMHVLPAYPERLEPGSGKAF